MTNHTCSLNHLGDEDLLRHVAHLAGQERHATAQLIASLIELDARKLYLREGCSSLFTYCTQVLHLSEHAAYGRIEAARTARRFPRILGLLADGTITLTTVTLLAPHLTDENHDGLLAASRHQSRREVEHLVATLRPTPDVPGMTRKLPHPKSVQMPAMEPQKPVLGETQHELERPAVSARPPVVAPLAPSRYKVQFTVSEETYQKLRRAQNLMRHAIPNGDAAVIFDRALTMLVEHLEKTKSGATTRPRASRDTAERSRHVPAAVRHAVWTRDGGQCTFTGAAGRCSETGFLEFHHVLSYASGGPTTVENIALRCRNHNQYEAALEFPLFIREQVAAYVPTYGPALELGSNRVLT